MTAILGINPQVDGYGAAVVIDGRVMSAVEQFKIRERRSLMDVVPIPREAIAIALDQAKITAKDLDMVAFIGDGEGAEPLESHIRRLGLNSRAKIEAVATPAAHSAVAFYSGPFERAVVLILDRGPAPGVPCLGVGANDLVSIMEIPLRLATVGRAYRRIASALGFFLWNANKTAWLGVNGEPVFRAAFDEFLSGDYSDAAVDELMKSINPARHQDIAATLHSWTNDTVVRLAGDFLRRHEIDKICIAGHLAENPLLVRELEMKFGERNVFVPPSPGRESLCIGAAWVSMRSDVKLSAVARFPYPALGPEFMDGFVKSELDNCKLPSSYFPSMDAIIEKVCKKLVDGGLVGWFQGRCEFGHRALGFRSILVNPFTPYVDENINRFLKHREPYHPFVISVAEESAADYFDGVGLNARTIASIYPLRDEHRTLLGKFGVRGGGVRVHTVNSEDNYLLSILLRKIQALTGHPLLLNTSFNLPTEPLAMTPRDAIRIFYGSGLDLLAIGRFLLAK